MVERRPAKASGIYRIKNQVDGECYIGSAVNLLRREGEHLRNLRRGEHCNPCLQAAFDKYGEEAFIFEVLEHTRPENLIEREQHYFDMLKPEYNIAPIAGSSLGFRHSPETRRKISETLKGHSVSEETRRKLSDARSGERHPMYGKHLGEEVRRKLSAANKGRRASKETRRKMSEARMGERNPMYGKHHSEEARRKIGEARRGKRFSKEHRRKLSEAQKAYLSHLR